MVELTFGRCKIQKHSRTLSRIFIPEKGRLGASNSKWLFQKFQNDVFLNTLPETLHSKCFVLAINFCAREIACRPKIIVFELR